MNRQKGSVMKDAYSRCGDQNWYEERKKGTKNKCKRAKRVVADAPVFHIYCRGVFRPRRAATETKTVGRTKRRHP